MLAEKGRPPHMLTSEKMELAIYKYITSAGKSSQAASMPNLRAALGVQDGLIIERLIYLLNHSMILLYRHHRGLEKQSYEQVVRFEGENAFWANSFVIEIAPDGRKYFEELEQKDLREQRSRLVFISCGQQGAEQQLGKDLAASVEDFYRGSFKGYFAQNQNSPDNLSSHIFKALDECAGFVAVMHYRGEVVHGARRHIRASVWVEQEIAIISFLTQIRGKEIPSLFYAQKGIALEGVRSVIIANAIEFQSEADVLRDFGERLGSGKFRPRAPSE